MRDCDGDARTGARPRTSPVMTVGESSDFCRERGRGSRWASATATAPSSAAAQRLAGATDGMSTHACTQQGASRAPRLTCSKWMEPVMPSPRRTHTARAEAADCTPHPHQHKTGHARHQLTRPLQRYPFLDQQVASSMNGRGQGLGRGTLKDGSDMATWANHFFAGAFFVSSALSATAPPNHIREGPVSNPPMHTRPP